MRIAEAAAAALVEAGLTHAFGVIGSGNFVLTRALVEHGVTWTHARHEGGAIVMADAFARTTGGVAACSFHQGPGFTNSVTGLAEAAKSHLPLLVLAADAATEGPSNFRVDQAAIAAAVGAAHERLLDAASAVRALRRAVAERTPVVLSMPIDVQERAESGEASDANLAAALKPVAVLPSEPELDDLARTLEAAERPLVIAGRGALEARVPIEALAERAGALLATSAVANGLFTGSPWSLGISGGYSSPGAAGLIREADLVLALGATLNMWTTRRGRLLGPGVRVIHVDLDPALGTRGDAAATAAALSARVAPRTGWRTPEVAERIAAGGWARQAFTDRTGAGRVDPRTFTLALDQRLPLERTLAIDGGHFMGWPSMLMRVPDARAFVFPHAFQGIGMGLAAGVGAAVARPDRLSVALVGDGGLLMGISELETAVRTGRPLLVVAYNDAAYGAEVHHFEPEGHPTDLVRFPEVDLAALAQGAGARGCTVRSPGDLAPLDGWLRAPEGVLLLDVKVVPDVVGEWLPEAFGH